MTVRIPLPDELLDPFSTAAAHSAGIGRGRLRGADLARPFHGVRDPRPPLADASPATAAIRAASSYRARAHPSAVYCGRTAAAILGIPLPPTGDGAVERIHVAVPHRRRAPEGRGIVGRSMQLAEDEVVVIDGLPITSPSRTWCDLGRELRQPDLVAAGDFLIRAGRPVCDLEVLEREVERYGSRPGSRRLRASLPLLDARSESPQESRMRVFLVLGGVSGLVPNLPVTTSRGHRYRIDLAIPEFRIAIEYQGDYHRDPRQFRADLVRRSHLEGDGWLVIMVGADHLTRPDDLVDLVRRHLG